MTRQTFDSILDDLGRDALWEELQRFGIAERSLNEMSVAEIDALFFAAGLKEYKSFRIMKFGILPTGRWGSRVVLKGQQITNTGDTEIEATRNLAIHVSSQLGIQLGGILAQVVQANPRWKKADKKAKNIAPDQGQEFA